MVINEHFSTIIVTAITAIVSIVTLIIQKNNNKIITKMKRQTTFLEKENELKNKIDLIKQEIEKTVYNIQMLILDTNIEVLMNTNDVDHINQLAYQAEQLKKNLTKYNEEFDELIKEYNMVIQYNKMLQEELEASVTKPEEK